VSRPSLQQDDGPFFDLQRWVDAFHLVGYAAGKDFVDHAVGRLEHALSGRQRPLAGRYEGLARQCRKPFPRPQFFFFVGHACTLDRAPPSATESSLVRRHKKARTPSRVYGLEACPSTGVTAESEERNDRKNTAPAQGLLGRVRHAGRELDGEVIHPKLAGDQAREEGVAGAGELYARERR
jgi:hypothetical protein